MNFEKRLAVSLHKVKTMVEEGNNEAAIEALNNLWEVSCKLGRNKEAISCSYVHSEETVEESIEENKKILGMSKYLHEITL